MGALRLGILGCSEIAQRRFMPAAAQLDGIEVVAIAEAYNQARVAEFVAAYPLEVEPSFEALLARDDLDAVYVPQPPALHYQWALRALEQGKHVMVEKPSTVSYEQSASLVEAAQAHGLALHENYMFPYHAQLDEIRALLDEGRIGDIRLYRADFGFPLRAANDFRYNHALGGGALLDAGGYVLKLASLLLGPSATVRTAQLSTLPGYEVDMMGSVALANADGLAFQGAFGMDCGYRCRLEVWGSTGTLTTDRIFTAPAGFEPTVTIQTGQGSQTLALSTDSSFERSIAAFLEQVADADKRQASYEAITRQARLVEDVRIQAAAR